MSLIYHHPHHALKYFILLMGSLENFHTCHVVWVSLNKAWMEGEDLCYHWIVADV